MAQVVEVSRYALTGQGRFNPLFFFLSMATILAVFVACTLCFLRAETHLADEM